MSLFRPNVDRIQGYVPGEQPQESGWIKLNTNENPYPPSPRVVAALETAIHGRLNLYPDPLASAFRRIVGRVFNVDPDWVLPANGSDENLTLLIRSFIDPQDLVVYPYPSYILYETLVDLQGGRHARLVLNSDWSWELGRCRPLLQQAKLAIVPNPNSPSGNRWTDAEVQALIPPDGLLVLDEAYGDFCDVPHRGELLHGPRGAQIVVTRSLSKSYSLAGIRMGFALAHPDLIAGMRKMKDSYNCDTLSLAAATAALEDQEWMESNAARIRGTRARLARELTSLGFQVTPSQANFVWATHASVPHRTLYEQLKQRRILVRLMTFPHATSTGQGDVTGLRITVGTDPEIDQFLARLSEVLP
jgi:histidinol-phosphate aminotransferase